MLLLKWNNLIVFNTSKQKINNIIMIFNWGQQKKKKNQKKKKENGNYCQDLLYVCFLLGTLTGGCKNDDDVL